MSKSLQPLENIIESFPNTYFMISPFNWYAKRLAVSSSDGKIKIYSKLWAHPDFGST